MLSTIFGKFYGFLNNNNKNNLVDGRKLKGIKAKGQECFGEGRFGVDHILTLCTLIVQ